MVEKGEMTTRMEDHIVAAARTPPPSEDPDVCVPMTSRIVHRALTDMLSVSVALASVAELIKRLERTKQTLRDKRIHGFEE